MEKQPKWIVIYHNVNADEIQTFNVLAHSSLRKDIVEATKKCKTKEEFEKLLLRSMRYHYWSKSQWEIIISPWCGSRNKKKKRLMFSNKFSIIGKFFWIMFGMKEEIYANGKKKLIQVRVR